MLRIPESIKVVQESGYTGKSWFTLILDFNGEFDFNLADAAQIGNALERGNQSNTLSAQYGLSKLHLVHAVIHPQDRACYADL